MLLSQTWCSVREHRQKSSLLLVHLHYNPQAQLNVYEFPIPNVTLTNIKLYTCIMMYSWFYLHCLRPEMVSNPKNVHCIHQHDQWPKVPKSQNKEYFKERHKSHLPFWIPLLGSFYLGSLFCTTFHYMFTMFTSQLYTWFKYIPPINPNKILSFIMSC